MVPKSSQNGGPRLSKSSPERVSKKTIFVIDLLLPLGSKMESKMMLKLSKNVSKLCLERGLDSSAKKVRKKYPPKLSQEGSRLHESIVFTFSLLLQKVTKKVPKSSQNGGPRLSKSSSERVSKTCSNFNRFLIAFCPKMAPKVAQRAKKVALRGLKRGPERVLKAKGAPRASQRPP